MGKHTPIDMYKWYCPRLDDVTTYIKTMHGFQCSHCKHIVRSNNNYRKI